MESPPGSSAPRTPRSDGRTDGRPGSRRALGSSASLSQKNGRAGGRAERQYLQGGDNDKYVECVFFNGGLLPCRGGSAPPDPPGGGPGPPQG